jgi:hypothetical protein
MGRCFVKLAVIVASDIEWKYPVVYIIYFQVEERFLDRDV